MFKFDKAPQVWGFLGTVSLGIAALIGVISNLVQDVVPWPEYVTIAVAALLGVVIATSGIASLVSESLKPIATDLMKPSVDEVKKSSKELNEIADLLRKDSSFVDETIKSLRVINRQLEDTTNALTQQDWYFTWKKYEDREAAILADGAGDTITIYVVSNSLKFDTHDTLLQTVKDNIARGVNYRYIVKEKEVDQKKDVIRLFLEDELADCDNGCGDVMFLDLPSDDMILAHNYAILEFSRKLNTSRKGEIEVFMALDAEAEPAQTAWMRLRADPLDAIVTRIYALKEAKGWHK